MTVIGKKNHRPESGILDHAANIRSKGPVVVSLGQTRIVEPGNLAAHCIQQKRLCNGARLDKWTMLHIRLKPWEQAGDRIPLLTGAGPASMDHSAGG